MNVLIVDDERMSRTVITRLITKKFPFCSVTEAQNGIEALAILQRDKFDLLIADLNMPGMGGMELIQILRNDITYQDLPIVIVSIVQDKNVIVKLMQLGIAGYLVKPLNIEAAQQRIGAILQTLKQPTKQENLLTSKRSKAINKLAVIEQNIATRLLLLNFVGDRCPLIFAENENELSRLIPEFGPSHVLLAEDTTSGLNERQMAKKLRDQFPEFDLFILKYSNLDYLLSDETPFFDAVIQKSDNSSMFLDQLLAKVFNDRTPYAKLLHLLKHMLVNPLKDMLINLSPAFLNQQPEVLERGYIGRIDPDGAVRYSIDVYSNGRYKIFLSFEGRQHDIVEIAKKFVGAQHVSSVEKSTLVYSRFLSMLSDRCSSVLARYGVEIENTGIVLKPGDMYDFPQVWDTAIPIRFQPDHECMLSICLRER